MNQGVFFTRDELLSYSQDLIDRTVNRTIASLPRLETTGAGRYPEFLNRNQAAEFLGGISLPSLDKLSREKFITALHPTPERTVFHIENLRQHLLSQKKTS